MAPTYASRGAGRFGSPMTSHVTDRAGPQRKLKDRSVAVGVVARPETADAVARTVLRATHLGYPVLVTHAGTPELDVLEYARQLDVEVVDPIDDVTNTPGLRDQLAASARAWSHAGLVFQTDPTRKIAYEETLVRLQDGEYVVDAVPAERADGEAEVVVGIPAYNEANSIREVVTETLPYADAVVVADDGSDDDTARVAREAGATVVEHDRNRGYGAALRTLFEAADDRDTDHFLILDADGQHDPADVPRLVETQRETEAEIVTGSRFTDGAETDVPAYRRLGLFVVGILTNLSLGALHPSSWIYDTQCGFRCYNQRAVDTLVADDTIGTDMGASTDILHHANRHGYTVEEVGTTVRYDLDETSEYHPVQHGLTLIGNLIRTIEAEHPIASTGVPGVALVLVGLFFAYRTTVLYTTNGVFPPGHALTAMFFFLIGTYACFTAIILHSLVRVRREP